MADGQPRLRIKSVTSPQGHDINAATARRVYSEHTTKTLLLECEHDIQNFHNREKAGLPPHDPQCVSLPKAGVTGTKKRGRKGFDGDLEA